jgi:hypothetical protein
MSQGNQEDKNTTMASKAIIVSKIIVATISSKIILAAI